ncbi:hypothetical protein BT69DRAFT_1351234 [Atractiella rhizophila]|nr:hypothetical protein BT69DRAFT_1351234 [Atractiella rhizophila]
MSNPTSTFTFQSSPLPKRRYPRPRPPPETFSGDTSFHGVLAPASKKRNFAQSYSSDPIPTPRLVSSTFSPSTSTQGIDRQKVQGTFDTPSSYLDSVTANGDSRNEEIGGTGTSLNERTEVDELAEGQPPMKKRRGLTDTLLSVGLEAALYTTAIGYAAYQLWRDRGKPKQEQKAVESKEETQHSEEEQVPQSPAPPAYHEIHPSPQHRFAPRRRVASRAPAFDPSSSSSNVNFTPSLPPPTSTNSWWPSVQGPEPQFEPLQNDEGEDDDELFKEFGDRLKGLIDAGKQALTEQKPSVNLTEDELMEGVETSFTSSIGASPTKHIKSEQKATERRVPGFAAPTNASARRGRGGMTVSTNRLSSSTSASSFAKSPTFQPGSSFTGRHSVGPSTSSAAGLGPKKSTSQFTFGTNATATPNRFGNGRNKSVDLGRSVGSSTSGMNGLGLGMPGVDYGGLQGSFERVREEVEERKKKAWWENTENTS